METLTVNLGSRSYPIHIGCGLLDDTGLLTRDVDSHQIMVVTNETIAPHYLDKVATAFADRNVYHVVLPDGESYKTLDSLDTIISALLQQRFDRGCCLVALGGGVVGDVTGFAAATYQRGVSFIQIPTTLLAQVDSSVGGKTAVNHSHGKNMIGAFHQPVAVIADIDTLTTLPTRELCAGVAEVIKYGLIRDTEFFTWLEGNVDALLALDTDALAFAIRRSCENKAEIVAADEREAGVRALLNLGHTFGHGIENVLGYGEWVHGEAVAAGMCMAARMSLDMGLLEPTDVERITELIARANLPIAAPAGIDPSMLLDAMRVDKKNRDGNVRLILNRAIGDAFVCDDYPRNVLHAVLGLGASD